MSQKQIDKRYIVNFDSLNRLVEERYLRKSISPCGRLVLYGYTDYCTYSKKWNKYTLNARGSVYELSTGKIVAKAFPKFFNLIELSVSKRRNIAKQKNFSTFEKVDGSLGIVFKYDGEWMINTRGSFNSPQAIKGLEILNKKYNLRDVSEFYTLLVEIIYPENKIIVDYGNEEKLVLLSSYDIHTGQEIPRDELEKIAKSTSMPIADKFEFDSVDELIEIQKTLPKQEEGFVAVFNNNERVKFKSLEYLKIARVLSYITPLSFWRNMTLGKVSLELLQSLPEELEEDVKKIVKGLEKLYREVSCKIYQECGIIVKATQNEKNQEKALGLILLEQGSSFKYSKCVFSVLKGNTDAVDRYVMKEIRPKSNEMNIEELLSS